MDENTAPTAREALAEALRETWASGVPFEPGGSVNYERWADTLVKSDAFVRLVADSVQQTLADIADDWPEDGMTRAEAQNFILESPVAVGRDA